jgi:spore coat protein U-like protein
MALDGGQTGATDPTQRKMSKGTERVTYGLYRDAARSLPWGSTSGTNTASGSGNAAVQNLTVYGRIPAQTTPSPGLYAARSSRQSPIEPPAIGWDSRCGGLSRVTE